MVKNLLQCRRPGFDPWVRKIPWRREWSPTPVLPGEFQGQRSGTGCSPWGQKELDPTMRPTFTFLFFQMNTHSENWWVSLIYWLMGHHAPPPPAFFWIRIFAWLTGWSYRKNIVVSREHALVSRKLRKLHTAFHNVLISWTVLIKYNVYVHQIITLHTLNIQYRFFICPLYLTKARKKEKNTKNSVNWSQQKMFTVSKMYLP